MESQSLNRQIPWDELDQTISIKKHIQRITNKANYILYRTRSLIKDTAPETARYLWTALIRPLYDYCFPIMEDMTKATQNMLLISLRMSFKKALGLRKTLSQEILDSMIRDLKSCIPTRAAIAKVKIRLRFYRNNKLETRTLERSLESRLYQTYT